MANEFIQVEGKGDEDGRDQRTREAGGNCTRGKEISVERAKESEIRKIDP